MKRKSLVIGSAAAVALAAAAVAFVPSVSAQPYGGMMGGYGPGWMQGGGPDGCPGYGAGYGARGGWGPGWMHRSRGEGFGPGSGPGFGRGMMGPGGYAERGDLNLTTEQVKTRFEQWLTRRGNPRLKVGEVTEKDADTIEATIVTKDNALVERFAVNRHTGFSRPTGD